MHTELEKYLSTVDKKLKPLPVSERTDILKEVKGSMLEMESEGFTEEQIVDRLGSPKDLAKAYLSDLLAKERGFGWKRFLIICAFYSVVGFSGMFVIPCLAIMAPVFIICGIVSPIIMGIKTFDYLFNLGLPYMDNIGVTLGGMVLHPIAGFFMAIILGALLVAVGFGCWKLLVSYCKKVSATKSGLSI